MEKLLKAYRRQPRLRRRDVSDFFPPPRRRSLAENGGCGESAHEPDDRRRRDSKSFRRARRSRRRNAPGSTASWSGCCQLDGSVPLSPEQGAAVLQGAAGDGDDGEAPWHDQTMPIAERMKLAEGRPLRRRMMAAMAQQDCGQCGYNCNDYSEAIASKAEARLNLCVPGGKETARMLKALNEELEKAPAAPSGTAAAPVAAAPAVTGGARPLARQSGARHFRLAPPAEQGRVGKGNLAHRFRPQRLRPRLCRRRFLRHLRPQRSRPCRSDHRHARRLAYHRGERQDAARRADRRCFAGAGAGYAVRTDFVHHRRRAAREGARAGARRGSRWRCRDARRDGGVAEILRRAAASRSLRRGAGAAAAAALFDLLVAQRDARQAVADGRLRALRGRQAQAAGPRLDLPCRAHQARRRSQGLCAEGAWLRAADRTRRRRSS